MQTQTVDRRLHAPRANPAPDDDVRTLVQQGLRIQASLGTIGAVEFLKAHDVDGRVIHRVLTSPQVRAQDRAGAAAA